MRKGAAFGIMGALVLILAAADYLILTSVTVLSRLAGRELDRLSGGCLQWRGVRASMDGTVVLEGASLRGRPRRDPWLEAERVEIRLEGGLRGIPRQVILEGVRVVLDEGLVEDLSSVGGGRSIRDLFPRPEDLPRLICRGGRVEARYPRFLKGEKPQRWALRDLAVTPLSGYRVLVEGSVENPVLGSWRGEVRADLAGGDWKISLATRGWPVGPELREALAREDHRELYDRFRPAGRCDLAVAIRRGEGGAVEVSVVLNPQGMELLYGPFPARVEGIHGEIEFRPEGFRIKHTEGCWGAGRVRIDGAGEGYEGESPFALRVEIEGLPLEGGVREALPAETRRVWDLLQPRGRAHVRGWIRHLPGRGPERIELDLELGEAAFRYRDFPYEVRNVTGEIAIRGRDVEVRRLISRDGGTEIVVTGRIGDAAGEADVDLEIQARSLLLDGRLRAALPEEARRVWDDFSPSGPVDVHWWVRREAGREPVHRAVARARGNSVLYREVPLPISEVEGEIELERGRVRLPHLRGKVQGAAVEVAGTSGEEGMALRIDAVGLPLNDAVKEALPREVGDLLRAMRLEGTVHFKSEVQLRREGGKKVELDLKLLQGVIRTDPKIEDLHGQVTLIGFFEAEPRFMGSLDFSRALVAGRRLRDLSASFNGKGSQIHFSYLKGTAYGGLVSSPGFSIDTKTGDFSGTFHVDRLDLREYALDTEAFAGRTLAGKLSLELRDLAGRAGEPETITGRGTLRIREGLLWDIPVFMSLFTFNPQDLFKSRHRFDAGNVEYEIRDRKFRISSLAFTSSTVSLAGQGRVNFDGDLHLRLKIKSGPLFGIDFIITDWVGKVLDFLTGAFVGVDVTGTFEDPKVSARPLPGLD